MKIFSRKTLESLETDKDTKRIFCESKKCVGFTLIELIITVTIIITLAGSVLAGIGPMMRTVRVGNAFNKMVFMVQQARSAAAVSKGDVDYYGVEFGVPDNKKFSRFEKKAGDVSYVDSFVISDSIVATTLVKRPNVAQPCGRGSIEFAKKTAAVSFYCDGLSVDDTALMEFGLDLEPEAQPLKRKTFVIHKQAGIPQIQPQT